MRREDELLRFVSRKALGIEIAPFFKPLTPKSGGFNCRTVDVFDAETLVSKAKEDPNIPNEHIAAIEKVDFLGDASRLDDLLAHDPNLGGYDYIVSSHNFEHLPNPVRFLQGCLHVLRPGGVLSMAIPDYRACFDHFRFPTRLADWIDAFHEDRQMPAQVTLLDANLNTALYRGKDGSGRPGFALGSAKLDRFTFGHNLPSIYRQYVDPPKDYIDTHCSVTCPETFHLLVSDLIHMGLLDFEILSISKTNGFEYFVHLRKPENEASVDYESYSEIRPKLLNEARLAIGNACDSRFHVWLMNVVRDKWARRVLRRMVGLNPYVVEHK
ncbi:MAG: methyltransferase domain-containing protein [Pseudomonadota bacterium]